MMDPNNNESEILAYDRPTYIYRGGFTVIPEATRNMIVYTGSRWFAMRINGKERCSNALKLFECVLCSTYMYSFT